MDANPNIVRNLRGTLYQLKMQFGSKVQVYKMESASTDYETGVKTSTTSVINVQQAVVMPASTVRKMFQGISYLSASKPFASQGGEGWDGTSRAFIFSGMDLPGYKWEVEDWVVHRDKRYDVSLIEELDYEMGWLIVGKEVKGLVPERTIDQNVVDNFDLEGEAT